MLDPKSLKFLDRRERWLVQRFKNFQSSQAQQQPSQQPVADLPAAA